jgi:predicted transcriptional regulator
MAEEEKKRRGRPVTPYKVNLMVRITQEAADKIADIANKSEYIDELIKKDKK